MDMKFVLKIYPLLSPSLIFHQCLQGSDDDDEAPLPYNFFCSSCDARGKPNSGHGGTPSRFILSHRIGSRPHIESPLHNAIHFRYTPIHPNYRPRNQLNHLKYPKVHWNKELYFGLTIIDFIFPLDL
ncbi:uncharacterized protein LOC108037153 [Drosophila rhopaloa]|uniref:Uncharacterized protein LOC108037153 n=1 Tax=Drosophila rhopaloa TaxID=1041015 RepID=A0A6P4E1U6_DRORH|nr:uncharacterized protein LOC108037153 [Drosophila rhopaloa]